MYRGLRFKKCKNIIFLTFFINLEMKKNTKNKKQSQFLCNNYKSHDLQFTKYFSF